MWLPQAVIYDMDGTLFDSYKTGLACGLEVAKQYGLPVTEEVLSRLANAWGMPTDQLVKFCWPDANFIPFQRAFNELNVVEKVSLFPGVEEALSALYYRGIRQGIYTSRRHSGTNWLLEARGISKYLSIVRCRDDVKIGKPSPDGLNQIINELRQVGVSRERIVYVGDGPVADYECARAAGVRFLAVTESKNVNRESFLSRGVPEEDIIGSVRDLLGLFTGWK